MQMPGSCAFMGTVVGEFFSPAALSTFFFLLTFTKLYTEHENMAVENDF